MIQIEIQSTNYNGQLADITFYPCSGGTISLGVQTIPYIYTNDNYQGTYDLFFSAFSQTCQLVITCLTPTPTITPTMTVTPTVTPTSTPSPNVFDVTNSGLGAYIINGQSNPTLTITEGETYTFNINAVGHPFWIKTVFGTGTANAYNDGVTNNGTDNGVITFVVPYTAPSTLYYNCQYHISMGGTINVIDVPITPTPTPTTTTTPTVTPTPTITPTASPAPAFDPDAAAYLNDVVLTGGTLDATMSAATNSLFIDLKSNGLYSKLDVLYLTLGSTSGSTALNAIRTAPQYDIEWYNVGDLSFGISGATGGGTGYGDTNYNPNGIISATDLSWGIYHTTGNFGANNGEVYSFGAFDGTSINNHRYDGGNVIALYGYNVNSTRATLAGVVNKNGSYIATFDSFGVKYLYKDITSISTSGSTSLAAGGSAQVPNQPYFLFTLNLNGSPYTGNYFNGRIQSWYIGDYLTPSEVIIIDGLINTFHTTLGRNLY